MDTLAVGGVFCQVGTVLDTQLVCVINWLSNLQRSPRLPQYGYFVAVPLFYHAHVSASILTSFISDDSFCGITIEMLEFTNFIFFSKHQPFPQSHEISF